MEARACLLEEEAMAFEEENEYDLRSPSYRPSWIDRFNDWVERSKIPAWLFYALLGITIVVIQLLFLWWEGDLQGEELIPVIVFNGIAVGLLFGWVQMLDRQAIAALESMKHVLEMSESELEDYRYRLSTMPFLGPLLTGAALAGFLILMETLWVEPARYAALDGLPIFGAIYQIIDKSTAFLYGVFFYHTVRQLRIVNRINSRHVRINLFYLRPLQAFSRLTATTALGLVIGLYAWWFINPDLLLDPVSIAFGAAFTIAAVCVFAWPLYGVHRLIDEEKEKTLREIDLRFEAAFVLFNQRLEEGDEAAVEKLNGTIASLDMQHRKVEGIPTWPWRPETARNVLTAIALPLFLMVIRFVVERAFGI